MKRSVLVSDLISDCDIRVIRYSIRKTMHIQTICIARKVSSLTLTRYLTRLKIKVYLHSLCIDRKGKLNLCSLLRISELYFTLLTPFLDLKTLVTVLDFIGWFSNSVVLMFLSRRIQIALKVNKFQNEFMKSSFLPKYEPNSVKIHAFYSHCAFSSNLFHR